MHCVILTCFSFICTTVCGSVKFDSVFKQNRKWKLETTDQFSKIYVDFLQMNEEYKTDLKFADEKIVFHLVK